MTPEHPAIEALTRLDRPTPMPPDMEERVLDRITDELARGSSQNDHWAASDGRGPVDITTARAKSDQPAHVRLRRVGPAAVLAVAATLIAAVAIFGARDVERSRVVTDGMLSEAPTVDVSASPAPAESQVPLDPQSVCGKPVDDFRAAYVAFGAGLEAGGSSLAGLNSITGAQLTLLRHLEAAIGEHGRSVWLVAQARAQISTTGALLASDSAEAVPPAIDSVGATQALFVELFELDLVELAGCEIAAVEWPPSSS